MKQTKKTRSILFFLVSTSILLLACFSTLLWQNQQNQRAQAADLSFASSPTLPAATVDSILARMGSPMTGAGNVIEQASQSYQIDDAFALAVWNVETSEGAAGVGRSYLNPGGVRASPAYPAGLGGYTLYPTYAQGVQDWFRIVRSRYVDRGLSSVYTLCVPYVGTSHAYEWAAKVSNLMLRFRNEAPPPAPPTPTPTPLVYDKQLSSADARMLQISKIVTAPEPPKNPVVTHPQNQQPSSTSIHQPLAFAFILLAALVIALAALFFGKKELTIPVREPEKRYEPITPLPIGNSYSQLLELDTAPQLPAFIQSEPTNPFLPMGLPSLGKTVRATEELHEASQHEHGGLLKRYVTTQSLEGVQEEYLPSRITEDLAYRQMLEVSERERVSSGAGTPPTAFRRPRRLVPLTSDPD